jgi:hypothetical protein
MFELLWSAERRASLGIALEKEAHPLPMDQQAIRTSNQPAHTIIVLFRLVKNFLDFGALAKLAAISEQALAKLAASVSSRGSRPVSSLLVTANQNNSFS